MGPWQGQVDYGGVFVSPSPRAKSSCEHLGRVPAMVGGSGRGAGEQNPALAGKSPS